MAHRLPFEFRRHIWKDEDCWIIVCQEPCLHGIFCFLPLSKRQKLARAHLVLLLESSPWTEQQAGHHQQKMKSVCGLVVNRWWFQLPGGGCKSERASERGEGLNRAGCLGVA